MKNSKLVKVGENVELMGMQTGEKKTLRKTKGKQKYIPEPQIGLLDIM